MHSTEASEAMSAAFRGTENEDYPVRCSCWISVPWETVSWRFLEGVECDGAGVRVHPELATGWTVERLRDSEQ